MRGKVSDSGQAKHWDMEQLYICFSKDVAQRRKCLWQLHEISTHPTPQAFARALNLL